MRENNELERTDIAIDRDILLDDQNNQQLVAYIETWFDVDKKFGTKTDIDEGSSVDLYAIYNPTNDHLHMEYVVKTDDGETWYPYSPTESEKQLVKDMIAECIKTYHNQTPTEYCLELSNEGQTIGGIQ